MSILFVNACVRVNSRTKIVAREYLQSVKGDITEVDLQKLKLQPLDGTGLENRNTLIASGRFDDDFFALARQFAEADEIVIAAPFWDLAFPALLKIYLELVTVGGITFRYDKGKPIGLCKAKKLTYITTAGGKIFEDFGYSYVKSLAKNFYGIADVISYRVENLDVKGVVGDAVLQEEKTMVR